MAKPSIVCHFLVPCLAVQWDGPAGPNTTRTLERVGYVYRTDLPDGFAFETDFWLFARLGHFRPREFTRELNLTFVWHDDPQRRPEVWSRPFQTITFRPQVVIRDFAAPVLGAVFEGPGLYEFQLWHWITRKWDQSEHRRTLARAYIRMEG